jgi:DNA-binding NarL/FixJ family response regulator
MVRAVNAIPSTMSLMVVDDSPAFRLAVETLVQSEPGFEIVAEAATGEQALDMYRGASPDVVVMDIRMPGMGGIEATRRILGLHPHAAVVLVSSAGPGDLPAAAHTCGAAAVILKPEMDAATFLPLLRRLQSSV